MLRGMGYGAYLKAAISGERLQFVGFAIVDDADLVETAKSMVATFLEVATQLQNSLSAWEGGLRATDGAIVPEKSHWYLIDFVWKDGCWEYASVEETPAGIQVRDCNGTVKLLERLPVFEARRTLGIRLAPDGNNDAEVKFLRERTLEWADCIRMGHLPRRLVWELMQTTILKSIQYPLLVTMLSQKQCTLIMAPLLKQGLSSSGVVHSIPRKVVYGPTKFQGLGVSNLFTFQKVEHIFRSLKYCWAEEHLTGQFIRQSLEATKLEIGCEGPLLSKSFHDLGMLATPMWITHTWEYLSQTQMAMEDDEADLRLFREGD